MNTLISPRITRRNAAPVPRSVFSPDRLFEDLWSGLRVAPAAPARFSPRIDVRETETEYVITAEVPGLDEKDVEVTLEDNVLKIRGEKRAAHTDENGPVAGYKRVETVAGSFERSFAFPVDVDPNAVTARSSNGVLTITLPKPEDATPEARTIPVTTA